MNDPREIEDGNLRIKAHAAANRDLPVWVGKLRAVVAGPPHDDQRVPVRKSHLAWLICEVERLRQEVRIAEASDPTADPPPEEL